MVKTIIDIQPQPEVDKKSPTVEPKALDNPLTIISEEMVMVDQLV
jgi:hypothetical protein